MKAPFDTTKIDKERRTLSRSSENLDRIYKIAVIQETTKDLAKEVERIIDESYNKWGFENVHKELKQKLGLK